MENIVRYNDTIIKNKFISKDTKELKEKIAEIVADVINQNISYDFRENT